MRIMVLVKASAASEAGEMPSTELLAQMGAYNEALVKAGVIVAGEGLHPSRRGVRVDWHQGTPQVTDGPFAETKELLAGFWLWDVASMAEAVEWIKKMPQPRGKEQQIELRPVFEADDFGEALTPELREQEERLRRESAQRG